MAIQSVGAGGNPFVTSSNSAQTQQTQQAQQAQQARQAQQSQQAQQQERPRSEQRVERPEAVPPKPVTNALGQPTGTLINVAA